MRAKRKIVDNAAKEKSRRGKASDEERAGTEPIRHAVKSELPSKPKPFRTVTLPLVPSKKRGTLVLDNAKIFEIIPFP